MMTMDTLFAVTALDGRYQDQLQGLGQIVGEGGLIRYRIMVEAGWLLHMSRKPMSVITLNQASVSYLEELASGKIAREACEQVKAIEKTTNHDVKAVEYFLRDSLKNLGSDQKVLAHIHFACTSEDINNLAYGLMLKELRQNILLPQMDALVSALTTLSQELKHVPMLSRTHGQTATPSTLGKELAVFAWRLNRQKELLEDQPILGKFNGAVGNYNAHVAAYPQLDWMAISKNFVEQQWGLQWNPMTTQIENHDSFVEYMSIVRHFNTIMIDFVRDMWGYISVGYFVQKVVTGEVGSSTMPHKVNPIYFENAEGNLGVASSLLNHFSEKLPISRWQRDLSDSTVLRVTGTAIGHSILAWKSAMKGLSRVGIHPQRLSDDLNNAWEVLAEPVQTVMRRYGVVDAYERLKSATRGEAVVTKSMIHDAIDGCSELPNEEKQRMKAWTPGTYIGLAEKLVCEFI